jgi:hypothetical protein
MLIPGMVRNLKARLRPSSRLRRLLPSLFGTPVCAELTSICGELTPACGESIPDNAELTSVCGELTPVCGESTLYLSAWCATTACIRPFAVHTMYTWCMYVHTRYIQIHTYTYIQDAYTYMYVCVCEHLYVCKIRSVYVSSWCVVVYVSVCIMYMYACICMFLVCISYV